MERVHDISVVVSTYNRSSLLATTLNSLFEQRDFPGRYEVIVVDNNSSDDTAEVVRRYAGSNNPDLVYVFEPRQGVSHARNTGIANSRAPIVAFVDDDVWVARNWLASIRREFDANPDVVCIGGKVLPQWDAPPPNWLTREHWSPIALQDYGDQPVEIDGTNQLCLLTANIAFRKRIFAEIGRFDPALQRIYEEPGSTEDAELLERLWSIGGKCRYSPDIIATTAVPANRMTRAYHRRWHAGHGRFFAMMRSKEFEKSSSRLFDIPSHLLRQAFDDACSWSKNQIFFRRDHAFYLETRLRFTASFFATRWRQNRVENNKSTLRELCEFLRLLISKNAFTSVQRR